MLTRLQCASLVLGGLTMFVMSATLVLLMNSQGMQVMDVGDVMPGLGKSLQSSTSLSMQGFMHRPTVIDLGGGLEGTLDLSSVTQQLERLQEENENLKAMLKKSLEHGVLAKTLRDSKYGGSDKGGPNLAESFLTGEDATEICIDMVDFLGTVGFYMGVSYDPMVCFPPLNVSYGRAGPEALKATRARVKADLVEVLSEIKKVDPKLIDTSKMYHENPGGKLKYPEHIHEAMSLLQIDSGFLKWRDMISVVLSRYLGDAEGNLHVNCKGVPMPTPIEKLGSYCLDLPSSVIIDKMGYYIAPFESIDSILSVAIDSGFCSTHARNFRSSYVEWLKKDRMTPQWKTFDAPSLAADHVVFLFDMLYERELVFTKQRWMGVATMQNPFDMYSIQDIMYTVRPDLLIETGTASGGSALLWSGIMELVELEQSKIITVDVNEPSIWNMGPTAWTQDPMQHKLWKKRVIFLKGFSTDKKIIDEVTAIAKPSSTQKKVLVTLDSGHDKENVLAEMEAYCPLVSLGSYCIVEDTKMSRWHSTGPLAAVQEYIKKNPGVWEVDRHRELLYTHHAHGYLRRLK